MAGLYDEKILGLRQQREFARKIREQASQGVEAGSMVSGHYVPNYGGMVANAMRQIMSGYEEGNAQNQEEDLTRQKLADTIKYMNQAGIEAPSGLLAQAGTKAVEPSLFSRAGAFLTGKEPPETIPAQPYQQNVAQNVTPDQYEHAITGVMGVDPEQANPMVAMYQAKQNRALKESEDAYRKSHDEATLAQQVAQKEEDRRLRKDLADQADATRRDTASLIHSGQNSGVNDQIVTDAEGKMWAINPRTHQKTDLELSGKVSGKVSGKSSPETTDAKSANELNDYINTQYITTDPKTGKQIDAVDEMIKNSTSGGLQNALAKGQEWLTGEGTSGQEKLAALGTVSNAITLKALNGKLGSGISNADREFLQSILGDISNPEKASNVRRSAWATYKNSLNLLSQGKSIDVLKTIPKEQVPVSSFVRKEPNSNVELSPNAMKYFNSNP